jgi:hypothetical protein
MTGDKVMLLSLINVLGIFNSPVSTYEGIKVMLLSLCSTVVGYFNSPTQFPPIKQGLK